ncbi:MAG: radical SAM family heme chaperone HemW [Lachnospiraceae bacterium]|nr:radical SAM family heme chaperone HemW [Lachnospiraceae bacterium]
MKDALGLYLHFPFCVKKCAYCDFLSAPAEEGVRRAYAKAMIAEIQAAGRRLAEEAPETRVDTVFLGGGTPSVMPADTLFSVFEALKQNFSIEEDAEITMEVNPGTLGEEMLSFIKARVNRVSVGLQGTHEEELRILGRIHSYEDFLSSFEALRMAGVRNLSVDLMSALPGQTEKMWEEDLIRVISQSPEHISAYSLIIEEGTPFYEAYARGAFSGRYALPDEETERRMYYRTKEILESSAYERYEISNYARAGFASRHNLRYWERRDYLGFGIGAASLFRHVRWNNTRDLKEYLSGDYARRGEERLSRKAEMEEFMFLGLRKAAGVSFSEFESCFGAAMTTVYGKILERHLEEGLLARKGERVFLTERGFDLANSVMAAYLFD